MAKSRVKDFNYVSSKKYDGMIGRCYRKKDISYKNYGAKGIKVTSEWIKDINTFRVWLLEKISELDISVEDFVANSKSYQLDRIDSNGNYTSNNCRICSPQANSRNKNKNLNSVVSAEGEVINLKPSIVNTGRIAK